jgi:nucleoid-associated protein YgaU
VGAVTGLEKATLTNSQTLIGVPVQFNPEEYTVNRESSFAQLAVYGLSAPIVQFLHGNAQTIDLELLVDTTESSPAGPAGSDVRDLVALITKLMDIDPTLHAPPPAVFAWGRFSFTCVVSRVNQRYVLFRPDGTPVRARLTVQLTQYRNVDLEAKEIKRQTTDYTRLHVVTGSETLPGIAGAQYGDPTAWRPIALRNGVVDPRALTVGTALAIPRLPYTDPRTGVVYTARSAREAS